MIQYLKLHLSSLLTGIFVVFFLIYALINPELINGLRGASLPLILVVVTARLVNLAANGLFTKWSLKVFSKTMLFRDAFYVSILSSAGNFFGPLLGGAGIRAVYLKKKYSFSYSDYTAVQLIYFLILFIISSVAAIAALFVIDDSASSNLLLIMFSIWLFLLLIILLGKVPSFLKNERLLNIRYVGLFFKQLSRIEQGWIAVRSQRVILFKISITALIGFVVNFVVAFAAFNSIGVSPSVASLLLYSSLVAASLLVSVTPGAIGIREAILIVSSTALGVDAQSILQVSLIDRSVNFMLLGALILLTRTKTFKGLID